MPKPFHQLTLEQFVELLQTYPFTRRIESVHMHHTWRPNRAQYKGLSTIEGMWAFHTGTQGWSDIAQHISIAPDGTIWTGRNWNRAPASADGFNGNAKAGPFMFEMIGDFDQGRDAFEDPQKRTVLGVIAHVQKQFKLAPETLRLHNAMSSKTCPGSAIDYATTLREVAALRAEIDMQSRSAARSVNFPFADGARGIWQVVKDLEAAVPDARGDEGEGCNHEPAQRLEFERTTAAPPPGSRASARGKLPPEKLKVLRPHVINLNQGRFSSGGDFDTDFGHVDAMFEQHLQDWARGREGKRLPIVFYAHGGLTSEQGGLLTAHGQVQWWLDNGAYPIHFVWETGFLETLGQLLNPNRKRAIDWAAPSDFAIETLARSIGGIKIWGAMKASAERAVDAEGGARYAAKKLAQFCARPELQDRIELHAVGHSAGSIFHSHFIPAAREEGAPPFRSAHFLAPAVRVDTFERQLLDKIGQGKAVEQLTIFTMARDFELDDTCMGLYRKSLLYLIHDGLEVERATPILGLEESIRGNAKLKRLFNLDNAGEGAGEVVWSKTSASSGTSASNAVTHGGFNDDAATMQSVAQRILGGEVTPFPQTEERGLSTIESLQAQDPALNAFLQPIPMTFSAPGPAGVADPLLCLTPPVAPSAPMLSNAGGGRKRALCVGIDRYPTAPLAGCVNDARLWRRTFLKLGFEEPQLMVDGEATRSALLDALSDLLRSSKPGDVVAFQFSGHGTQLPDLDGDEKGGDSADSDEALCPIDFDSGRFVIDDDIATLFNQIPQGVSVTVFADCCHSGSNTRLAIGKPPLQASAGDVRRRFIRATDAMRDAHAVFRKSLGGTRGTSSRGAYDQAREVLFSACRSREVALESNGQGHFTTRAVQLLTLGIQGLTNEQFHARVVQAFGANSGQNPELHCAKALRAHPLLGAALDGPVTHDSAEGSRSAGTGHEVWRTEAARMLEGAARALRG